MLALLGTLITAAVIAPAIVLAAAPVKAADRVGVYERIIVTDALPGGSVSAGYLAPEGWSWMNGRDGGAYLAADRTSTIVVELRADASDPRALLREGLPVGALGAPAETHRLPSGLLATRVESDLAAGDGPTVHTTVCASDPRTTCVVVHAVFGAGDRSAQDQAESDLQELLSSVEIIG